jgi:hypothetical protein
MFVNGLGGFATATTVGVVTVAKFAEGAWVTVLLIPGMMGLMYAIRRHYRQVEAEVQSPGELKWTNLCDPLVVVPIFSWNKISQKGMRFALTLSSEITALHIECSNDKGDFVEHWRQNVEVPVKAANRPLPELVILKSPYRFVLTPILDYILDMAKTHPDRQVVVLIPELVEKHWYHYFLHNQSAEWLRALLLAKGNQRIVLVSVPWYSSI